MAERSFFNAIRLANQNNPDSESNIEAASYNELSLTSFGQNDLKQALKYAENGLGGLPAGRRATSVRVYSEAETGPSTWNAWADSEKRCKSCKKLGPRFMK